MSEDDDILLSVGELKSAIDEIVERHKKPSPVLSATQPSLKVSPVLLLLLYFFLVKCLFLCHRIDVVIITPRHLCFSTLQIILCSILSP